jgi:hypothetical protein
MPRLSYAYTLINPSGKIQIGGGESCLVPQQASGNTEVLGVRALIGRNRIRRGLAKIVSSAIRLVRLAQPLLETWSWTELAESHHEHTVVAGEPDL